MHTIGANGVTYYNCVHIHVTRFATFNFLSNICVGPWCIENTSIGDATKNPFRLVAKVSDYNIRKLVRSYQSNGKSKKVVEQDSFRQNASIFPTMEVRTTNASVLV